MIYGVRQGAAAMANFMFRFRRDATIKPSPIGMVAGQKLALCSIVTRLPDLKGQNPKTRKFKRNAMVTGAKTLKASL